MRHRQEALSLASRQRAPEHHQSNLMTALLTGRDFVNCDIALSTNHKTNTLLQSNPSKGTPVAFSKRSLAIAQHLEKIWQVFRDKTHPVDQLQASLASVFVPGSQRK